jgi:hypothetical protein
VDGEPRDRKSLTPDEAAEARDFFTKVLAEHGRR